MNLQKSGGIIAQRCARPVLCYNPVQQRFPQIPSESAPLVASQTPPPFRAFLHPRHWLTWIGLALLYVVAWLPLSWRLGIGALLGRLTWLFARERRYITTINIRLCFPELAPPDQDALVYRCFIENGIGLIETTTGWMRPPEHFQHLLILSGTEHIDAALAQGRGVLLVGAHYTTLDFSANLLGVAYPFAVTYRPHRNPLFNALMLRGRLRNCNGVFDRHDIRGAFRHLKQNKIVWYAPDQDYGPDQAVFAPFFGRPAATITATTRFASFNNSPVVLLRHHRLTDKKKYVMEFIPVPTPFPSGDAVADATLINQMLETAIRMEPAQYMWMHKRFKTQPYGKPQSPYILVRTPVRKLDEALYAKLTAEATELPDPTRRQLKSGLQLWSYNGLARGLQRHKHPLLRLEKISNKLRAAGVVTVTVDSLFLLPFRRESAATCHIPRGEPLNTLTAPEVPTQRAALFLARLHDAGFHFADMDPGNLLLHNNRLALLDPLCLLPVRKVGTAQRLADLSRLAELLGYGDNDAAHCLSDYLQQCRSVDVPALRALLPAALAAAAR